LTIFTFLDGVIPSAAAFQAERGISRGASRWCAPDPSARSLREPPAEAEGLPRKRAAFGTAPAGG